MQTLFQNRASNKKDGSGRRESSSGRFSRKSGGKAQTRLTAGAAGQGRSARRILPGIVSGSIQITEAALASLIGLTAHEIPGVVGMAPANLKEGLSRVLGRANVSEGVVIGKEGGKFTADIYVVAAYGVSIPTVARNIVERVEHVTKTYAGIELAAARVHAMGVQRV